jgi:hypothetical protein
LNRKIRWLSAAGFFRGAAWKVSAVLADKAANSQFA